MENLKISRIGEPELIKRPDGGSLKMPSEYRIRTTALPAGPRGINWRGYFNDQLKGPLAAFHDGNAVNVTCHLDDHPDRLEKVDAAIEKANEEEGKIQYEKGTV